jgi:bacillithiol system protein YtxJ
VIVPLAEKRLPTSCLVFKHSTTCPLSAAAAAEVRALETALPVCWINVREQRELSSWVASALGVRHESPQLILVREARAVQIWNHGEVRRANVEPAIR